MADGAYDTIAAIWDLLVPDALLTGTPADKAGRYLVTARRATI